VFVVGSELKLAAVAADGFRSLTESVGTPTAPLPLVAGAVPTASILDAHQLRHHPHHHQQQQQPSSRTDNVSRSKFPGYAIVLITIYNNRTERKPIGVTSP